MAYYSKNIYVGDGSTTNFGLTFGYLNTDHVKVSVDDVDTAFTWVTSSTVQLAAAPAVDARVVVYRVTPITAPINDFSNGSVLNEEQLDPSFLQALYVVQEAYDSIEGTMGQTVDGYWDANSIRIINVADPVDPTDAVNLQSVESITGGDATAAAASAAAAAVSETNAAASEAAAAVSETNAAASETAAAASAAEAASYVGGAEASLQDVVYVTFADSPVTVTTPSKLYSVDTSGGSVVFNLPSIASLTTKFMVAFKKTSADTNSMIVNGNGTDLVDGGADMTLSTQDAGAMVLADTDATPDEWTSIKFGAGGGGVSSTEITAWGATSEIGTDITSAVYDTGNKLDVSTQTTNPRDVWVSPDETFLLVSDNNRIFKYTMSTPGDLTTASYDSQSPDMASGSIGSLRGVAGHYVPENSITIYVLGDSSLKRVWITSATGNFDLTTIGTTLTGYFGTTGINSEFTGMMVKPDGTQVYVCGGLDPDTVGEIFYSEAWTHQGNGGVRLGDTLNVFAENPSAEGIIWTDDGWQFGILDDSVGFAVYNAAERWRVANATYVGYLSTTGMNSSVWGGCIRGTRLYVVGTNGEDAVYLMDMTTDTIPAIATYENRGAVEKATIDEILAGLDDEKFLTPRNFYNSITYMDNMAVALGHKSMGTYGRGSSNSKSVAIGAFAGANFNGCANSVAIGYQAAGNNGVTQSVVNTVSIGYYAGYGNGGSYTGDYNICIGSEAGRELSGNTADNILIGRDAGKKMQGGSGGGNVYIGKQCGPYISYGGGSNNIGLGLFTLYQITTGSTNTCLGQGAGDYITTGSNNVCIGKSAGPTNGTLSDKLYIDNNRAGANSLIYGDFNANTITINGTLTVTGGINSGGYTDDTTGTTINFSTAPTHRIAPTASSNPTYTFTAPVAGADVKIIGVNLGSAGTITWPATVKWAGGAEPSWSASGTDLIRLVWDGTSYWASATLAHA